MKDKFNYITTQFSKYKRKNAYIHHYHSFNVDDMHLLEAESNILDMVSEFNGYEYSCVDYDLEY